jgi:hypothetical protein
VANHIVTITPRGIEWTIFLHDVFLASGLAISQLTIFLNCVHIKL